MKGIDKNKTKEKWNTFIEYMDAGSVGLMVISSAFCIYGASLGIYYYFSVIPPVLCVLAAVISLALEVMLVHLLAMFIFKGRSVKKIFFVNLIALFAGFAVALVPVNKVAAITIFVFTGIIADIWSRCLYNTIRRRKYIFGYVLLVITTIILVIEGYAFFAPGFGDDLISKYAILADEAGYKSGLRINKSAISLETEKIEILQPEDVQAFLADFKDSIKEGIYTPICVTYGLEKSDDIFSRSINLQTIEKPSKFREWGLNKAFGRSFRNIPLSGRIWYPKEASDCPTLFIVHGAHDYRTPSHEGYDYLGKYLATHGYVVISVDETIINMVGHNSTRAVLFLENMKQVISWNHIKANDLYEKIDEANIAIAGHSRGGETVATAYLFNDFDCYPENADVEFDYHFLIKGIIAIAPTVDQYQPGGRSVSISNVNYLIIHGSHDEDVMRTMGEKQYTNVTFKGDRDCFKSLIYIYGANHGQFNDLWGRYDNVRPLRYLNNVNNFISMDDQKKALSIITKNFLDITLKNDDTYKSLFYDIESYKDCLPRTVYQQMYEEASLIKLNDFEDSTDTRTSDDSSAVLDIEGAKRWREAAREVGLDGDRENHVLLVDTGQGDTILRLYIPQTDLKVGRFTFAIGDITEDGVDDTHFLDYSVALTDSYGHQIRVNNPKAIMPSLKVELFKTDSLVEDYSYKHQLTTVMLDCTNFDEIEDFDMSSIVEISIIFHNKDRSIAIDDIGIYTEPISSIEEWRKEL